MTEFKKWAVTYVQQFWLGYLLVKSKLVNTDVTTKKQMQITTQLTLLKSRFMF